MFQKETIPSTILLLLSHFSRARLCATPEMTAHQAPPSLGFSRPEHWSGLLPGASTGDSTHGKGHEEEPWLAKVGQGPGWLPFPSPVCESEKWKWSRSVVSNSWWPHGLQPTRLLRPWDFPGKSTGVYFSSTILHKLNKMALMTWPRNQTIHIGKFQVSTQFTKIRKTRGWITKIILQRCTPPPPWMAYLRARFKSRLCNIT